MPVNITYIVSQIIFNHHKSFYLQTKPIDIVLTFPPLGISPLLRALSSRVPRAHVPVVPTSLSPAAASVSTCHSDALCGQNQPAHTGCTHNLVQ